MYSANLTSLLARPAKEPPIGTLPALEEAMREHGYELVVESHSSSLSILEVSFRLWVQTIEFDANMKSHKRNMNIIYLELNKELFVANMRKYEHRNREFS